MAVFFFCFFFWYLVFGIWYLMENKNGLGKKPKKNTHNNKRGGPFGMATVF
jgi:hypothetical protein